MAKQADSNFTTQAFTRRALVRAAVAISAVTLPVACAPPVASAAVNETGAAISRLTPSVAPENPELLHLGEKLKQALGEYRVAVERKNAARHLAEALCPAVPNELLLWPRHYLYRFGACDRQTDIEGNTIHPKPPQECFEENDPSRRGVVTAERLLQLRQDFAASGYGARTGAMREIKKLLAIAERYETGRRQAINAAGLLEAVQKAMQAAADLHCLCDDALHLEAQSATGLRVLTDAVQAQCECADNSPYKSTLPHTHAPNFARSIRRVIDQVEAAAA